MDDKYKNPTGVNSSNQTGQQGQQNNPRNLTHDSEAMTETGEKGGQATGRTETDQDLTEDATSDES